MNVTVGGVAITTPTNNLVLYGPERIFPSRLLPLISEGIGQVEFFEGANSLGTATNEPYGLVWIPVTSGAYASRAVALNSYGHCLRSGVVNVTVDIPSSITLTNPANNARFAAGSDIGLCKCSDPDGTVVQVEFYEGTNSLGVATSPPYSLIWSNVASGAYALTARATDNCGLISTSAVVNIVVAGISIISPANNMVLTAPASVAITATVTDDVGINQVNFSRAQPVWAWQPALLSISTWTDVPSGAYMLAAVATYNDGLVLTSSVVNVIIDADPIQYRPGRRWRERLHRISGRTESPDWRTTPDSNGIINLQIYTPLQ